MKKYGYNEQELDTAYNVPENAVFIGKQIRKKFTGFSKLFLFGSLKKKHGEKKLRHSKTVGSF